MRLFLRDRAKPVVDAWREVFAGAENVQISQGDIFSGQITQAIVSPANSFGFMDGGIDGVYSVRWPHIQAKLQSHLRKHHLGEIPVGSAVIIPIHDEPKVGDFAHLISAPTMRIPAIISGSVNAYLAMRAALVEARRHGIEEMLCPGLGTAVGRMDPKIAALQMLVAWNQVSKQEAWDVGPDLSYVWDYDTFLRTGVYRGAA